MATMTVYDGTAAWTANGNANPTDQASFDLWFDVGTSPILGTRPIYSTYGNWADGQAPGFDITQSQYIGLEIDYGTISLDEDGEYDFSIDSDDMGQLYIDGTLVSEELAGSDTSQIYPITLLAGSYSIVVKFQNGTGSYSFSMQYRKPSEVSYTRIDNSLVGLTPDNSTLPIEIFEWVDVFTDYPHKLVIKVQLDGAGTRRRVVVQNRATLEYVASAITDNAGYVEFTHLPIQAIDEPHIIVCFDDRNEGFLNALIYDRVYQVTNQGFPPEN